MSTLDRVKRRAVLRLLLAAATALAAHAQVLTTLATFNKTNGSSPGYGTLLQGKDGNLYGTTGSGGTYNQGIVFKLAPDGTLTTLYNFGATPTDGSGPNSGLIQAADGNLYGTTVSGGANSNHSVGLIYKIAPDGTYSVLYTFCAQQYCADGVGPWGPLLQASDGNFYGTTWYGGYYGYGTIFKITKAGSLTTLYSFCTSLTNGNCGDGARPLTALMQASDGNLYGSTSIGGFNNGGTIFRIGLDGTFKMLYMFPYYHGGIQQLGFGFVPDTSLPAASQMIQGADGNLYGTTVEGGANGFGQIFKMGLDGTFTTVYSFSWGQPGGMSTPNGLLIGMDGNFYGTTQWGGTHIDIYDTGVGTIFKMTPAGVVTTLHIFDYTDGAAPAAALIQGADGNLYGTTQGFPYFNSDAVEEVILYGTVFKLALQPPETLCVPPYIESVNSAGSYGGYSYFASGSWLEIIGAGFANPSDPRLSASVNPGQWTSKDFTGPNAPTMLDGNSVSINGKPAYVWYISPGQLNVQAPEDTATGNVAITLTNYCNAASPAFMVTRQALAPGLLAPSSFKVGGTQYIAATFVSDGADVLNTSTGATLGINSRPAKPGDVIIAYGIGFGDVTPSILPGTIAGQPNALVNPITVSFGSTPATLVYAGLGGGFVGLYEFYITVPPGLANGDYQINVKQNGVAVPQTLSLTVHN